MTQHTSQQTSRRRLLSKRYGIILYSSESSIVGNKLLLELLLPLPLHLELALKVTPHRSLCGSHILLFLCAAFTTIADEVANEVHAALEVSHRFLLLCLRRQLQLHRLSDRYSFTIIIIN
ncbi:hypothetical protein DQ04_16031020 [Trypanosoma grayi]|uniref:hypothetical protein n=1 Tax=Trypanosoma grayi TaxID=71804 RepID=UPI0004F40453|nr:hypothetical protein DQ04_16031020 [Trypanosoma grayi]KEG06085.1 hypothetical protein DQ04_16031020 [Trypanosoma grayi]